MTAHWQDDPNLMGTAIDAVVKRTMRQPLMYACDEFWYAVMTRPDNKSMYAALAYCCRVRVLAVCGRKEVK